MAADGEQGVAKSKLDKNLMDMNMPVLDGWHAASVIRGDSTTQGLPIIGLTAHVLTADREKALEAGCNDYHIKPVNIPVLTI